MALDKPYKNVPGTTIFDAEQARKGYNLNQFCMSLMKPENRERYLADRGAYLDEWPLNPVQRQAVLDIDLNTCIAEGGNIYFLAKIGATHGLSFQQMAGSMTGMSEAAYRDMMIGGGRRPEGNRLKDLDGWTPPEPGEKSETMRQDAPAKYTSALFTSHVPAIGAAMDLGKTEEPYWKKVFSGYEWTRKWAKENTPDVVILVYNDHATAFDSSIIPTFVLGTGAEYPVADEGYGPRPVPDVKGYPELAAHIAQSVIQDDFDLTLVNEMVVDHGLTVPLSLVYRRCRGMARQGHPARRKRRAVPGAVRPSLLRARARRSAVRSTSGTVRAAQRADLGHRRHEPPAAGPARWPHQRGVGQRIPRPPHRRPRWA